MGFKRGKSLNHSRSSGSVFPEVDLKKLLSKSFFFLKYSYGKKWKDMNDPSFKSNLWPYQSAERSGDFPRVTQKTTIFGSQSDSLPVALSA